MPGPWCTPLARETVPAERAEHLAAVFEALGDPVRLRPVSTVSPGGEACVCDLAAFDLSRPTISYHLGVLRQAGLLGYERRGTRVFHRLVPEAVAR